MMEQKTIPLEKLRLDKELATELVSIHKKWLRFLLLAEVSIATLNAALLMAGTVEYGKKTLETLRKKVEEV